MRKKNIKRGVFIENKYYVYEWYVKNTGEVFYIGKGKNNRARQIKKNKFFKDIYYSHDCDYRIVKNNLSEKDAFEYEIYLIKYYKDNYPNYRLTNQTNGGEGSSGWKPSEDWKLKQKVISEERWKNKVYRKKMMHIRNKEDSVYKSDEFRKKISNLVKGENNPNYGNKWSKEQKDNLSKKMKGRYEGSKNPNYNNKWTKEQKKHLSDIRKNPKYNNENHGMAKKVICMETYEIFNCIKFAKEKYPNSSMISSKRKVIRGYHLKEIEPNYILNKYELKNELILFYKNINKKSFIILVCVETLEITIGIKCLADKISLNYKTMRNMLKKDRKITHKGLTYIDVKDYSPVI